MTEEFLRRRRLTRQSDTAIMKGIGADAKFMRSIGGEPLSRSHAIAAIRSVLKISSGKQS
jgi:hypothetical protein